MAIQKLFQRKIVKYKISIEKTITLMAWITVIISYKLYSYKSFPLNINIERKCVFELYSHVMCHCTEIETMTNLP